VCRKVQWYLKQGITRLANSATRRGSELVVSEIYHASREATLSTYMLG